MAAPRRRRARRKPTKKARERRRRLLLRIVKVLALLAVVAAAGLLWLDREIAARFEDRHAVTPTRVYSRPLEWFPGSAMTVGEAAGVLESLGYRRRDDGRPGSFAASTTTLRIVTRDFDHEEGTQPSAHVRVRFGATSIASITRVDNGDELSYLLLDPVEIGVTEATRFEDRQLLRLHEAPEKFLTTLLLVEDRNFSSHPGFDPLAILRALVANLRAGGVSQGGSTITQQLVKNLYLDSSQTLTRKIKELLYALLLERRYGKDRILEAYINEVFLAQSGNRAIHGFGLGSEHFFGRPLAELEIQDYALLVGMVKAPTSFNPRRNPERARERRAVVLDVLAAEGLLSGAEAERLKTTRLGVTSEGARSGRPYAAFMDLVRRQLDAHGNAGQPAAGQLRVWSTLEPEVQRRAEQALAAGLGRLEKGRGMGPGTLQGAVAVLRAESGQVLALVGDRQPGYEGFNRALDARRPVGSLLKPVVALAAFESAQGLHPASLLDDGPLTVDLGRGRRWEPGNYDGEHHGLVTVADAIEQSYNVATARLGLEVGVETFARRVRELSGVSDVPAYPASLLGAVEMSPLEVARLYQVFASGGLGLPARAFTSAVDENSRVRVRFPAASSRLIDPGPHFLAHSLLAGVVERGTAREVLGEFGRRAGLAGKTGTTDGFRDSWFAGYSGNYLVVVWIGRDDNRPTGLSGASGALTIFRDLLRALPSRPARFDTPDGVRWLRVDPGNGLAVRESCTGSREMPFLAGAVPPRGRCGAAADEPSRREPGRFGEWLRRLLPMDGPPREPEQGGRR